MPYPKLKAFALEQMKKKGRETLHPKERIALEISYRIYLIQNGGVCEKCTAAINLTLDHIVPQVLLYNLGFNNEVFFDDDNLQLLCKRCNLFKGARLDFTNPRTKPLLQKYIDTVPQIIVRQEAVVEFEKPRVPFVDLRLPEPPKEEERKGNTFADFKEPKPKPEKDVFDLRNW